MEKQKLILYLRDVFELEKQKRVAQKTINYMAEEYQKAKGNFEEGQKRYNMKMKASHYIPLGICVFFILSMIINMIEMFDSDISFSSPGRGVLGSFVYAVISGAVFLYFYKKDKDEQIELNAMAAVLGHKGEQDMAVLNKNYQWILGVFDESKRTLEKLYSLNIIYPKYRYFEACGMFLEYFMAGRTGSLEANGADQGAYNIYEYELLKETNIRNQYILIEKKKQISEQIDALISGIDEVRRDGTDIKISAETSSFCDATAAYNTTVVRRINENQYYG